MSWQIIKKWFKPKLSIDKLQENMRSMNQELITHIKQTNKSVEEVKNMVKPKPKPEEPIALKITDPFDAKTSLFELSQETNKLSIKNKTKIKNGRTLINNILGAIPEIASVGLLTKSYRFVFPKGVSGEVIKYASGGQGSAILNNSGIAAHGAYYTNVMFAIPVGIYSFGSVIVRLHFLNKINKSIEALNEKLEYLITLVFTDKRATVDAIIHFYKKAFHEFDNVNTNEGYRNAMLTNIIAKNIEVYELVRFYGIELGSNDKASKNSSDKLKAFVELHELFLYGKMLSFMYANLYDIELVADLKLEFNEITKYYTEVLSENKNKLELELKENREYWYDRLLLRQSKKSSSRSKSIQELLSIDSINRDIETSLDQGLELLEDVLVQIQKPQEYLVEEGELYLLSTI